MTRLSRFVGAPVAGVLIVAIGASNLLWIDAATFAVSALLISLAVPVNLSRRSAAVTGTPSGEPPASQEEQNAPGQRYFARLAGGIAFLWRDP
jgi:hypothetical protein